MLVAPPPQLAPSKLVQFMKGRSSRLLQHEFPAFRKRYWGNTCGRVGITAPSVGAVDEQNDSRLYREPAMG
jgi:putative transposase